MCLYYEAKHKPPFIRLCYRADKMNNDEDVTATTMGGLRKAAEAWHRHMNHVEAAANVRKRIERDQGWHRAWNILIDEITRSDREGVQIIARPLPDELQLLDEGINMSHCVATYDGSCSTGRSRIFSIRRDEERLATTELSNQAGRWRAVQTRGYRNGQVPEHIKTITTDLASEYQKAWLGWEGPPNARHQSWLQQETSGETKRTRRAVGTEPARHLSPRQRKGATAMATQIQDRERAQTRNETGNSRTYILREFRTEDSRQAGILFEYCHSQTLDALTPEQRELCQAAIRRQVEGPLANIGKEYAAAPNHFIVACPAEQPETIAGYCAVVHHDAELAELKNVVVSPDHQGHGIAAMLLHEAEHSARRDGHSRMKLWSYRHLTVALRMYERRNYRYCEIDTHEETEEALGPVGMEKTL